MLSKLKKALGFGNVSDDDLISDDPDVRTPDNSSFNTDIEPEVTVGTEDINKTTRRIFTHIIDEFNKALPSFLAQSVDPEREKEALYNTLSADLKAHLSALEKDANRRVENSWRAEREKLQKELKNISDTAKDIEAKRSELKSQQLSSDRQRRALSERVRELEKQVAGLEADKEQLDLEIKSMLNKVKVSQVYEKECQSLREQVASLQSDLNNRRVELSGDRSPAQSDFDESKHNEALMELERLKAVEADYNSIVDKMTQVEGQMSKYAEVLESKDAKIGSLSKELTRLNKEFDKVKKSRSDLEEELSGVRSELAEARKSNKPAVEETPKSNKHKSRRVALPEDDDILNDTDWIVNAPNNRSKSSNKAERSKQKKSTTRDDGQMSLW